MFGEFGMSFKDALVLSRAVGIVWIMWFRITA